MEETGCQGSRGQVPASPGPGALQAKSVEETGGLQFPLWRALDQVDSIRTALKNYYLIGFEPAPDEAGRQGNVIIKVARDPKCRVAALPVLLDRSTDRR